MKNMAVHVRRCFAAITVDLIQACHLSIAASNPTKTFHLQECYADEFWLSLQQLVYLFLQAF